MNRQVVIFWIAFLFVGDSVLSFLNIPVNMWNAGLLSISMIFLGWNRKYFKRCKELKHLFAVMAVYSVIKLYTDTGGGTRFAVLNIIGACIFFSAFPKKWYGENLKLWKVIAIVLFVFFILESGLAVFERIRGANVFGWRTDALYTIEDFGVEEYRSTSFWGHPLGNAQIVSTIMTFILLSPFRIKYKMTLWSLGYLAILSFNTRSSIMGNALILVAYLLYTTFRQGLSFRRKIGVLCLGFLGVILGYYLIYSAGWGGRLLNNELMDGSTMTRFDVWSLLDYLKDDAFWIGVNEDTFAKFKLAAGLYATENFLIDWMFKFGVPFISLYIYLYIKLIKRLYTNYDKITTLFTAGSFMMWCFTCNSLSTSFVPMVIFLMCIEVFDPTTFRMFIPRKYLDTNISHRLFFH